MEGVNLNPTNNILSIIGYLPLIYSHLRPVLAHDLVTSLMGTFPVLWLILVGLISEFWNCLLLDKKVDNLLYNKIFFPMTSVSFFFEL